MAYLTDQDLDELDKRLDSSITLQPALALPRDVALIHLLRRFEAHLWSPDFPSYPPEAYLYHSINGQDAMHFAVSWIFQHCPEISGKPQVAAQEHAWQSTGELFESAMRYKTIWDYMSMCRRKHAIADRDSDGTIRLRYVDQRLNDFRVADRFISTPDSPEDRRRVVPFEPAEVISGVRSRYHRGRIKYIIPPSI